MLLRYISDIHFEFIKPHKIKSLLYKKKPSSNLNEICILAGDIGSSYSTQYDEFMNHINSTFIKSFVIAGNHEYYSKTHFISDTKKQISNIINKYENISFLDDSYEKYGGYCFIGTTLWSKITNPQYKINDVYSIPNFDYIKYNRLHRMSVDFLEHTMENLPSPDQKYIIITHHMPSAQLIDIKYKTEKMRPYNQWFYVDMDEFIAKHSDKIRCWIYGHTHTPLETVISDVPFQKPSQLLTWRDELLQHFR